MPAVAQESVPEQPDADIVVRASRLPGSIDTDVLPTMRLDADAIRKLGVVGAAELVKKLGLAPDGAQPIYTLNGRLPASTFEIFEMPMEAFRQFESFPASVATKFGYPPTRKVLNFITKDRFGAVELKSNYQAATEGGSANHSETAGITRIRNQRRLTLTGSYTGTSELRQNERRIVADPALYFDTIGNVTGAAGGAIDPRLTALAGGPVLVAPVPSDPAGRGDLAAYLDNAGTPRITDTAAFRTLIPNQQSWKLGGAIASPIGSNTTASFAASLERKRERSVQGLPAAILPIAAANPYSPFDADILLHRYLDEAGPVRQRTTSTIARAALGGSGTFSGWGWNLTASIDRQQLESVTRGNVDIAGLTARIADGTDPFARFGTSQSPLLPDERSRTILTNADMRVVMNGTLFAVPAGHVTLTAAATAQHARADRTTQAIATSSARLGRFQSGASVALNVPVTMGLSLDAKAGLNSVSRFGAFVETSYGLNWKPMPRIQLVASIANARNAPALVSLASPIVTTPNTPFFDFVTGESVLVTAFAGGNPNLKAERRRIASINLDAQPIASSELRLGIGYADTRIADQVGVLSAVTQMIQAAFPDAYVRGASGQLVSVNFQPLNFALENQRDLSATFQYYGNFGKAPPPDAKAPRERVGYFLWFSPSWRLEDTLLLRRGLETLDLLDGDTVGGTGGPPRFRLFGNASLSYRGTNLGFAPSWQAGTRIRSPDPASDLTFSGLFKLNVEASAMLDVLAPKSSWARGARISLSVDNLFNERQRVRDRNGVTPNRYQPALLDPQGRWIQLNLRKLF
ncbi:TonB-dependent receptor domain-containing protein [Sphingomonas sp. LM7]|uniref:TonB-dependent receptor domain-containing protein n=1 Tax=Sphingomonas sp. LM7 TaxID=1938607 RepID=UPI000983EDDD|nr:TonB-dependent receptor [Sphingomonas sp. LM7]AQR73660.1 hypothetical protein BXU08_08430 [Sphingomonas sp. LM7]